MRFSWSWLSDHVALPEPTPANTAAIAARLTAAGFAVEHVEEEAGDVVLDIDVTTNRVDAMSHLGLARELAVLLDEPLRWPTCDPPEGSEPTTAAVRVVIEDERCPRYTARVVRGVRVGPSPEWLKARLSIVGVRSINNVVDITNYVNWELGQPLHAFDLATIAGATVRVRPGVEGEKLTTLDGVERPLDPDQVVIADAERAVALGGVMGGLDTEVTATTTDVLLESAHFQPRAVRRTARRHDLKTDAGHRFERGADPEMCARATGRAATLIQQLAGGTVLAGVIDERLVPEGAFVVQGRLERARLDRFVGVSVPAETVERWLRGLGFELKAAGDGAYEVKVPSWRFYDFQTLRPDGSCYEADLFEEVARLLGLEAIPATLPAISGADARPSVERLRRRRVADHWAACGYAEAINFAFGDPAQIAQLPGLRPEAPELALANPLSERYAVMRRALLPGLLESARFNVRRGAAAVRLYELGRVFFGRQSEAFPEEVEVLAVVCGGQVGTPWERAEELDFFDLKGGLEALATAFGVSLEARPATVAGMVAGISAELWRGSERVGLIGRLAGDDPYPLYGLELDLRALGAGRGFYDVSLPSRFPGVSADLTLTHALTVSWAEIAAAIEELRPADLLSFVHKDRYQGQGVPAGAVNTTIAFSYGSAERSLTQEEVNERQRGLTAELARRFALSAAG